MANSIIIEQIGVWQELSLQNSFFNFGTPFQNLSVRRLRNGLVEIDGCLRRTVGLPTLQMVIANIPSGLRPASQNPVFNHASGEISNRCDIAVNGDIQWIFGNPTAYFIIKGIYAVA